MSSLSDSDMSVIQQLGEAILEFSLPLVDSNLECVLYLLQKLYDLSTKFPVLECCTSECTLKMQAEVRNKYNGLELLTSFH